MRRRAYELKWLCVIPTWNSAEVIGNCLKSVFEQSRPFDEVVVVDNGSDDDTLPIVNQYGVSDTLRFSTNRGFSAAINHGMRGREFDIVVWLNADAELDSDFLAELDRAARVRPCIDMFAPKILRGSHANVEIIENVGNRLWLDGLNWCVGRDQVDLGQYDSGYLPLFPSGAVCGIRRKVFESIGRLDEAFFAYGEDADFGLRAVFAGHQTRFVPEARAHHILSHSLGMATLRKLFLIERNRLLLVWKNFPLPFLLVAGPLSMLRYCLWLIPVDGNARIAPMLRAIGPLSVLHTSLYAHLAAVQIILAGGVRRSDTPKTGVFVRSLRGHITGPLELRSP